jgi:tRNA (guanine-N7-)-methyltransferase
LTASCYCSTTFFSVVLIFPPKLQRSKLEAHPMFDPVSEEELAADPAAQLLDQASEEAQKVARNSGDTFRAVFRRRETPRDS